MLFPLVFALFSGVAFAGHALVARLLGARGTPFFAVLLGEVAPPGTAARRATLHVAGPLTLYAVLVLLFWGTSLGVGDVAPTVRVVPDSPAASAGLKDGDRIVSVGNRAVSTFDELRAQVVAQAGRPHGLTVRRDGVERVVQIVPDAQGRIGVGALMERVAVPPSVALGRAAVAPVKTLEIQARAFVSWLAPREEQSVTLGGPIAVYQSTAGAGEGRGRAFLVVLALTGSTAWALLLALGAVGVVRGALAARRGRAGVPGVSP